MDHVTVADLRSNVQAHWLDIRVALLAGTYQPQPVRRVEIPKPAGGVRNLGIPTVVARLIQQALLQVLTPILTGEIWIALMVSIFGAAPHQARLVMITEQWWRDWSQEEINIRCIWCPSNW